MSDKTQLIKPDLGNIPAFLRKHKRWAPWLAVWNAERGKWDKIPKNARSPEYGISTASPDKWFTFEQACAAYLKHPDKLDGIGFVMTDIKGLVGIDLDGCTEGDGTPNAWADGILTAARAEGGYVERSPSGNGFRAFVECEADGPDWNNHEVGIEVYGGSSPRFLTVTGATLGGQHHG